MTGSINVGLTSYECDMLAKLSDDLNMAQTDVLTYGLTALSALRWAGEHKLWAFHQADPTRLPFVVLDVDGEKMPGGQGDTIDEALIAAKIHEDASYDLRRTADNANKEQQPREAVATGSRNGGRGDHSDADS